MDTIEHLRSYRLYGYALFDFAATYLGAYLVGKYYRYRAFNLFLILCLLSIPIHWATGQKTKWMKDLMGEKRDWIVVAVTLGLCYYLWREHKRGRLLR